MQEYIHLSYITVYCDGSGDGHSIALFPNGQFYIYYEEGATNNAAEYNAVIMALFAAPPKSFLMVKTDSRLLQGHLELRWAINHDHLRKKASIVHELQQLKGINMKLEWVPRKQNIADEALRRYLKLRAAGTVS